MTIPTQRVLESLLDDPTRELYGIKIGERTGLRSGTVHRTGTRRRGRRLACPLPGFLRWPSARTGSARAAQWPQWLLHGKRCLVRCSAGGKSHEPQWPRRSAAGRRQVAITCTSARAGDGEPAADVRYAGVGADRALRQRRV